MTVKFDARALGRNRREGVNHRPVLDTETYEQSGASYEKAGVSACQSAPAPSTNSAQRRLMTSTYRGSISIP